MQINQLKYLIEVAETGSINKAAQNLFVSQPNLSNAIVKLENEFNIKIFNRTNRGVELTKEGKEFLNHAKYIVNQVENIENMYSNLSKEKKFILDVSCAKSFDVSDVLIKIYSEINSKNIKIALKETHRENVVQDVANMDSEIGIIIVSNLQEKLWNNILEIHKLEFNEISKDKMHIYVGEKNPLYNNEIIYPHELKDMVCIYLAEEPISVLSYNVEINTIPYFNKKKAIYLNDKETIANFILGTDVYTFASVWNSIDKTKGIRAIPLVNTNVEFKIGWIKRKREELSDEARLFIELITKKLNQK